MFDPTPHHGHIGDKVSSIVIAAIPLMAGLEDSEIGSRLMLALCGGAGSLIALLSDRPANWQEAISRLVTGFLACAMLIPYLAQRYGFEGQINAVIAAAGVMGIVSWYLMGSFSRFLRWLRTSNLVSDIIRAKVGLPPDRTTTTTTTTMTGQYAPAQPAPLPQPVVSVVLNQQPLPTATLQAAPVPTPEPPVVPPAKEG